MLQPKYQVLGFKSIQKLNVSAPLDLLGLTTGETFIQI